MIDPYFLQKLTDFRASNVDERTPHFHPSAVPAVYNRVKTSQGLTNHSENYNYTTPEGPAAWAHGLVEDMPYFTGYTGAYRTFDHRVLPTGIIPLKLEEDLTGTYSGEGVHEEFGYYATSANNYAYQATGCLTIPVKNPTDADVIIPAGALYAGISSGSSQRPARVVLSVPDAANGSVTAVTHTTLHNSTSNNWNNHYNVSEITVPANTTIMLHIISGTHTFHHNTTYDVEVGANSNYVRGMMRFMNASLDPVTDGYVEGSFDSVLKPDYQVLMSLLSRKHFTFVDVFNDNSDIKKAM